MLRLWFLERWPAATLHVGHVKFLVSGRDIKERRGLCAFLDIAEFEDAAVGILRSDRKMQLLIHPHGGGVAVLLCQLPFFASPAVPRIRTKIFARGIGVERAGAGIL